MPTPGLYPRDQARPCESKAELAVYEALKKGLPKGWYAWHSLRLRDRHGNDAEGDFVIAAPDRGLLVIEVKGGTLELSGGHWMQNGRRLDKLPMDQALGVAHKLAGKLREQGRPVPPFGAAMWAPDTASSDKPQQEDMKGRFLGQLELDWAADALPVIMDSALPPTEGEGGRPPPDASRAARWIDALHAMWGETWTPALKLGDRARMAEDRRVRLDGEQLSVLDGVQDNDRVLVRGGAGTGKSLLALECARREAARGRSVLLVCFTKPLAGWLASAMAADDGATVRVDTIRAVALELMDGKGVNASQLDQEGWDELGFRAATEGFGESTEGYDTVIVDEAQDFTVGDWALVERYAEGKRLWAFCDSSQAFWEDREVDSSLFGTKFRLTKCYRTPPALQSVADAYLDEEPDVEAVPEACAQGQLSVVSCPSVGSVVKKVETEIDKLLGEGLSPSDIAVVSLRGQSSTDSVLRQKTIGKHRFVAADDDGCADHIVGDTFLRFKGMERPAIIVTDLRLVADKRSVRMHIALTRALLTARVVAPKEVIEAAPLLSAALS